MVTKNKDYKIHLGSLLNAIDKKDINFYSRLTESQKKEFSAWNTQRWASFSEDKFAYETLLKINYYSNINFSVLNNHPLLQWMAIAASGPGHSVQRRYIKAPSNQSNKIQTFLSEMYPLLKYDDLKLLEQLNSKEELKQMARDYGYQDNEIKSIFGKK